MQEVEDLVRGVTFFGTGGGGWVSCKRFKVLKRDINWTRALCSLS